MEIKYLVGDATRPQGKGPKIIAHVCNDIGAWGKGFVMAVSNRWKLPEREYRKWAKDGESKGFRLGNIQLLDVEKELWVANMIGQHGIRKKGGKPPIRYEALESCLLKLEEQADELKASVHMPRIGAGLAGGDWNIISKLIQERLADRGIEVFVYDFKP